MAMRAGSLSRRLRGERAPPRTCPEGRCEGITADIVCETAGEEREVPVHPCLCQSRADPLASSRCARDDVNFEGPRYALGQFRQEMLLLRPPPYGDECAHL